VSADLPVNNVFNNIKPFNFGRIVLSYTPFNGSTTTNPANVYTHSDIDTPTFISAPRDFGSSLNNNIVNYNMATSFSNIKTSVTSNITGAVFNDSTFGNASAAITASNSGFGNPTPKWILGAWRASMSGLPFILSQLQTTYGNASFNIGPGYIIYKRYLPGPTGTITFNIFTNVPNGGFTSITAYYPQVGGIGPFGTFDCKVAEGSINNTRRSGGCLGNSDNNIGYEIYMPAGYSRGTVEITISLSTGQNISNIN
jgi:hypothetical protein